MRLLTLLGLIFIFMSCQMAKEDTITDSMTWTPINVEVNGQILSFQDSASIIPHSLVFKEEQKKLSYEEVIQLDINSNFLPANSISTIFDTKDSYWIYLEMINPDQVSLEAVLFLGYEQNVEIYGLGDTGLLGTMVALKDKKESYGRGFFLREEGYSGQYGFALAPGEKKQVYIRTERIFNKSLALDFKLMHPTFWQERIQPGARHFLQGLFQGIIWALILYHLLLFVMIKDVTYLYYSIYMVCVSILTLGDFGYWQGYLFHNQPYLGWCIFQAMQYISGIMTFVFMQSFVQLKKLMPLWDTRITKFIWANVALLVTVAILYFLTWDYRVVIFMHFLIIPFAVMGLLFCYLLIRSGDIVAWYFAIAGGVLSVSIAINAVLELLSRQGYILETDYTRYFIIQISVVIHLLTFSLGMGYRRRQKDLETQKTLELDKLKTRLYTNITHEFRTPLTVILGMNDQVKGNEKAQNLIRRNGQNLLRLINQMLDLSKLESGRLKLDYTQNNIVAYLQYLTESFHSMSEDKGIDLTFYTEEDQLIMDYDESKIQHIAYNLLSNAIKFTPSGGKVIFHVKKEDTSSGAYLQIKVKDTGIGVSPDKLPHIFDRFYQVDDSATRAEEGTGIGLALTKELVELMNGDISVESQLGKGTAFIISLPISKKAKLAQEPVSTTSKDQFIPISASASVSSEGPTEISTREGSDRPQLLLVEDNTDVIAYIQTLLEEEYQVHTAVNGQLGIDQAIDIIPDIIISDIMMPEKDGYEVCETLKNDQRTSHIPIILLTAKAMQEDKIAGLKYGADAYLTKPFDKEELEIRLKNLIENRLKIQKHYANADQLNDHWISPEPTPEDDFLVKMREVILAKLDDINFGVPQLAKDMTMSQMQVYRKLKALTDKTPSQFIRSIRLQKGMELIKTSNLNISEIAYDVGFSDPNYFSRTFQKEFGATPSSFRE